MCFWRLSKKKPALVSEADKELIEAFDVVMFDRPRTVFNIYKSMLKLFVRQKKRRIWKTYSLVRGELLEHT